MNKKQKQRRDWLGDIFLWSAIGTVLSVSLHSLFDVGNFFIAIPMVVFLLMLGFFFLSLVITSLLGLKNTHN
jgi:hypothetical protein